MMQDQYRQFFFLANFWTKSRNNCIIDKQYVLI